MMLDQITEIFRLLLLLSLIVCAIATALSKRVMTAIIRSITGKTVAGRFVGINMVTTIVVIAIFVLTLLLEESYLPDIALIYALISCVALIVLSKIYVNLFNKNNKGGDK